jgi:hypothetical protein
MISIITIIPIEIKLEMTNAFRLNELLFICFLRLEHILKPRKPNPKKY